MKRASYDFSRGLLGIAARGTQRFVERSLGPIPDTRLVYNAVAVLRNRYNHQGLSANELKVFSQNGEDGVIAELLNRIGSDSCFFVEFGVEGGGECNTRFLAEVLGWRGVYFEPSTVFYPELQRRYLDNPAVSTRQEFVTPETVEQLFSEAQVPLEFDLMSIDIDGQDYWVWNALAIYRPRLVVIEYNSALPSAASLAERPGRQHQFNGYDDYGCSLGALVSLGTRIGYTLVHCEMAGVNAFFVRDDFVHLVGDIVIIPRASNFYLRGWRHRPSMKADFVEV